MSWAWSVVAAVIWEFAEFVSDRYFGTGAQVSVADTMGDLLMGMLGAGVVMVGWGWIQLQRFKAPRRPIGES